MGPGRFQGVRGTFGGVGLLVACAGMVGGCSSRLDRIDRHIDRVLAEAEPRTGVAAPRSSRAPVPGRDRTDGRLDAAPPTANPGAEELSYVERQGATPGTPEAITELNQRLRQYASGGLTGEGVQDLTLGEAFRAAQRQGREYLDAEEDYLISAIGLLVERHRWGPRLFNDTSATFSGDGEDGRFDNALNVVNTMRATQRLPYGGEAEARWVWSAAEQLRSSVSGQYRQSSELVFEASVPLLRGAGMAAREDILQRERDLIYAAREFEDFRRSYFVSIASDYFDLVQTAAELRNQMAQIASLRVFVSQQEALYEAGRLSAFEMNNARNQLLSSLSQLASIRERFLLQIDRYKVRLGIPIEHATRIVGATFDLREPEVDLDAAARDALIYRLDLQNQRDRLADARRGVDNARNDLLPDLSVTGSAGIPTDADTREGGVLFDPDDTDWEAGLNLSLPLDRRIERLQLRQSIIQLERAARQLDESEDNVLLDVRQQGRGIDLARFRLELAEAQVKINEQRLREQELKRDLVDTRDRLDTEQELLQARNARDAAITDLRVAVLNFLLASAQLRVASDGSLEQPPGMTLNIQDVPIDYGELFAPEDPRPGDAAPAMPLEG